MSTDVVKESIAPLVQRILADPLHFTAAKRTEHQANRPQSYVKIGATHSKEEGSSGLEHQALEYPGAAPSKMTAKNTKNRPSSLAAALAGYTGKRVYADPDDLRKKHKKPRKDLKEEQSESSTTSSAEPEQDIGESLENDAASVSSNAEEEDDDDDEVVVDEHVYDVSSDSDEEQEEQEDEQDTNFTDPASPDFVSETPRNIISKKVFEQFKSASPSSSEENTEEEGDALSQTKPGLKDINGENEDEDEDEEEDDDYVEGSANAESGAEEDSDDDDEDEDAESSEGSSDKDDEEDNDVNLLKADLLDEKASAELNRATTPPTSPESDDAAEDKPTLSQSSNTLESFFKINEASNDKGSNQSTRIVKNWGTDLISLKPSGLLNHGVTCYTNAAVQAMIHIPAVQHYLNDVLSGKYKDVNSRSVTHVLAETAARMWKSDKDRKYINPKKLIGRLDDINCMMSEWQQEDSHEYFMSLLSRLQEDGTPKGRKLNESIIYDIFGGLLDQSVTCKNCGHVSKTQQEFYDLSLHLGSSRKNSITTLSEQDKKLLQLNGSSIPQSPATTEQESKQRYSIQKSIKDFFSPELIRPDRSDKSGYVCEECKQRTSAIKISSIDRAPETLAVHLKRFRFNGSSSSKVKQGVSYPLILDLSQYTTNEESVLYQLISVVVHEGRSVSSGHYIAHCRQPDGSWATYDDEYINSIPEKQALRDPSAYYLIYTRLTHKDIIPNPTPYRFLNVSPSPSVKTVNSTKNINQVPKSKPSQSPKPFASLSQSQKSSESVGITTAKHVPSPLKAQKQLKKQKIGSMVPTNNLGNVGTKNKRYASKNLGNSKRFKKY